MAVARLISRWALALSMFFLHNPTITSPYCHPKLPLSPEVRNFIFQVPARFLFSFISASSYFGTWRCPAPMPCAFWFTAWRIPNVPWFLCSSGPPPKWLCCYTYANQGKNGISDHRNSETCVTMKYESLSYLTLPAGNWQNPQKMRRGSSLLDIKKAYSFISCAYHLQNTNVPKRLKVMNQVSYIIIFLHLLSAKYPTACLSIQHLQETTLSTKEMWLKGQTGEKKVSKLFFILFRDVSEYYQKPRTSGKDVPDRGTMEEGGTVWLIILARHLKH